MRTYGSKYGILNIHTVTDLILRVRGSIDLSVSSSQHLSQFHVDKLSSAHVYLRMNEEDSWDAIPPTLLEDCAQLTKANSIEGITLLSEIKTIKLI
jgi:hypothetical protein